MTYNELANKVIRRMTGEFAVGDEVIVTDRKLNDGEETPGIITKIGKFLCWVDIGERVDARTFIKNVRHL